MADTLQTLTFETKFQTPGEGVLKGMAATYGGSPDSVGDVIQAGAFTDTLAQLFTEGRSLPMLMGHDQTRVVGKWTKLTDTPQGLEATGELTLDATEGKDAYALLKSGAISTLSIGYRTRSFEPRQGGGRTLTDIELAEISLVAIAANRRARVTDVKSADLGATTEAQPAATEEAKTMALDTAFELDAKLDKIVNRVADLEAKGTTPAQAKTDDDRSLEAKAFSLYTRGGEANMGAEEIKALNSSTAGEGGYLVPEDYRAELLRTVTEQSPMRQIARTSTTGRDELIIPKRLTKISGGWTAELAERNESEPTYGQIKIPVFELGVFTGVSNQNLEDSAFDMQAELTADFGESFGEFESEAFIKGDGVGKPRGILSEATIPDTATAAAGVVSGDDMITAFYAVKAAYRNAGAWLMNSATLAEVRKLKTASGDYIWQESLAAGQAPTILGRPVYEAVHMPDPITGAKAIIFGDFKRAYRVVTRPDIAVQRDPYTLATKSAVRFLARQRIGGDTVMPEAVRTLTLA